MMNRILSSTAMAGVVILAGVASSAAMESRNCAEFTAMDSSGRMEALQMAMMASDDQMASDDAMASDDQMASDDAMASDDQMASDDAMASDDQMASDDAMASDDQMASDDAMTSDDQMALQEKTASACADNPDMMLEDAMHEAMGQ